MKPYYYAAENIGLRKWDTLEEAQSEAERHAAKHPGRAFEILRCVGIAQCSQASTFWMNGEGPPEKPRYRELEEGETFQAGDEYMPTTGEYKREWIAVPNWSFGEVYSKRAFPSPHRRPI